MNEPELPGVVAPVIHRSPAFIATKSGRAPCEIIAKHAFGGGTATVRMTDPISPEFIVKESELDFRDHETYMADRRTEKLQRMVDLFKFTMSGHDLTQLNMKSFPSIKIARVAMEVKLKPETVIKKMQEARHLGLL